MNPQMAANAVKNAARLVLVGGVAVYGAANSLFTVEGGHKAIVFNRLVGIKDTVSALLHLKSMNSTRFIKQQHPPTLDFFDSGVLGRHALQAAVVREADHLRRQGAA